MAGESYYRLLFINHDDYEEQEKILNRIKEIYGNDPFIDYYSIKWHSMYEDMENVSKEFPNVIIAIEKYDNDNSIFDDYDECFKKYYFKNGKSVVSKGKVVYSPVNFKDLD